MLFKKGDIVVGNERARVYGITEEGTYWKVMEDCGEGDELTINGNDNKSNGPWYVNPKNFDLVKPTGYTFKIGDKVKLNPMCAVQRDYNGITLLEDMFFEGIRTVESVITSNCVISLKEDNVWMYSDDMLIPAIPVSTRPNTPIIIDNEKYIIIGKIDNDITLRKCEYSDISVGDKIEVVNSGAIYSTANSNMLKNITDNEEYLVRYAYGSSPENGFTGTVLAKGRHCSFEEKEIFLIGDENYGKLFLIGTYGIKKV